MDALKIKSLGRGLQSRPEEGSNAMKNRANQRWAPIVGSASPGRQRPTHLWLRITFLVIVGVVAMLICGGFLAAVLT